MGFILLPAWVGLDTSYRSRLGNHYNLELEQPVCRATINLQCMQVLVQLSVPMMDQTDQTQQASTEMCMAPWLPAWPAPVSPSLSRAIRSLITPMVTEPIRLCLWSEMGIGAQLIP